MYTLWSLIFLLHKPSTFSFIWFVLWFNKYLFNTPPHRQHCSVCSVLYFTSATRHGNLTTTAAQIYQNFIISEVPHQDLFLANNIRGKWGNNSFQMDLYKDTGSYIYLLWRLCFLLYFCSFCGHRHDKKDHTAECYWKPLHLLWKHNRGGNHIPPDTRETIQPDWHGNGLGWETGLPKARTEDHFLCCRPEHWDECWHPGIFPPVWPQLADSFQNTTDIILRKLFIFINKNIAPQNFW